jgi:predicted dehydrogenase
VSDEIRYGFIGTGMMGVEHIHNVMALPDAVAVAGCDPDPRSREWGTTAGGRSFTAYATVEALLERDDLDVLVLATPNHLHRSTLEAVWGRPVHLLLEKPLCTTVEDALAVRAAAADHPGIVWMALEYRYMPPITRLLAEVDAGSAGRAHMVSIREHRFPFLTKVGDWNRFTRNTGGTLVEKCCHFFDLMNQVLPGRPARVMASGAQDVNHLDERYDGEVPDILDNAFVVVDYDDGTRALLDLCMFAEGSRWEQEITVVGDDGKLQVQIPGLMEVARGARSELVVGSRGPEWPVAVQQLDDDERIAFEGGHHGASFLEHVELGRAIREGSGPRVTVDEGLLSVAMGVAAHRSIDERRAVDLDELDLPGDLSVPRLRPEAS